MRQSLKSQGGTGAPHLVRVHPLQGIALHGICGRLLAILAVAQLPVAGLAPASTHVCTSLSVCTHRPVFMGAHAHMHERVHVCVR